MTAELAVITALLAGFFGSSHCLGMCGAVVVLFEGRESARPAASAWFRRVLYNVGRGCFYALLGGIAGLTGAILTQAAGINAGLLLLRAIAAILVIAIGLNLIFDWRLTRFLESAGAGLWKKMSRCARHVLPATTSTRAFAAGFIWGALPCGLVYSAVAIAATSGNAWTGAVAMLAFWLGTLPALLLAGASADRLNRLRARKSLRRFAGILVILVGLAALMPFGSGPTGHEHHAASTTLENAET
jgi:sulfite exporter TauE/SafE